MTYYTFIIEYCPKTELYIGYVPGMKGAHSQGKTLDELKSNMKEVIEMIKEEENINIEYESQFIGTQNIAIAT